MAKNPAHFPSWVKNLGAMIDERADVQVGCTKCHAWAPVDIGALINKVGRGYSLINRRCPCRLTPGCKGWNKFYYRNAVFRPLWDATAIARWLQIDNQLARAARGEPLQTQVVRFIERRRPGIRIRWRTWCAGSRWHARFQAGFPDGAKPLWGADGASEQEAFDRAAGHAVYYWVEAKLTGDGIDSGAASG